MPDVVFGKFLHPSGSIFGGNNAQVCAAQNRVVGVEVEVFLHVAENIGQAGVGTSQDKRRAFFRLNQ